MKKKVIILLAVLIIVVGSGVFAGFNYFGKTTNRTTTAKNVTASSQLPGYAMTFEMTPVFADFFYERGFWNNNGIRIKKDQPHTVKSMTITLKDKKSYKGTKDPALPVILASDIGFAQDLKSKIYKLDVFVDKEGTKRYSKKDLARNIFLGILSQIYEDTARTETSYEARIGKAEKLEKIADSPGGNPITIK